MKLPPILFLTLCLPLAAVAAAQLPPPAPRVVDFTKDIKPMFEAACVKCHAKGKDKGGFSLETRDSFLKGGETEPGAVVGKSGESYVVELVAGLEPDSIMPKKGTRWTPEQVGLLRAWIDQGAAWPTGVSFAKPPPENLQPHSVTLANRPNVHPVDQLLGDYFAAKGVSFPAPVEDRLFARRVYLDLVGLLPSPAQLDPFLANPAPDKRAQLVRQLLGTKHHYADHWLTFWNDLLRNDYKGTGFIDGGRKQISGWLYQALLENKPYDRFVAELVNPTRASEGFARGIIWRGNVNASMLPPMQAAQNVSQVFLGVNLKCASCHDSFVNDWSLADAYGLAAVYADEPLDLIHCDKPTGRKSAPRFLYPEVGTLDPSLPKAERLQRLAEIIVSPKNGRLSRTIVNRLWARLMGRGLVEPLDDMEQRAWNRDLLDWLAEDLVAHGYDLKRTLEMICTSSAYQLPTVESPGDKEEYVFHGPLTRRLTAEQFSDALSALSGDWNRLPSSLEFDFGSGDLVGGLKLPAWIWTDEPVEMGPQRASARAARSSLADALKNLTAAQKLAEEAAGKGPAALEGARKLVEQGVIAVNTAQWYLNDATQARRTPAPGALIPEGDRHRVIFRKTFPLTAAPDEAYGVILASQSWLVQVNGREAKPLQRDGFRNGRIALFDLRPLLQVGENVIILSISSHTEKQMNDVERTKFPGSVTHLNKTSGAAFYVRIETKGAEPLQIGTDAMWRVQRNPEGNWSVANYRDADWALAKLLPRGVTPVDEGPSLQPVTRKDFANLPVELGPQLAGVVSTAAHVGEIRASLLAADPLQVALDRPNREVIVPARASAATTIQALELTNGATLNAKLQKAAAAFAPEAEKSPTEWLVRIYRHALGRSPSAAEKGVALEIIGQSPTPESVADFLWTLVNLPEFQLIN